MADDKNDGEKPKLPNLNEKLRAAKEQEAKLLKQNSNFAEEMRKSIAESHKLADGMRKAMAPSQPMTDVINKMAQSAKITKQMRDMMKAMPTVPTLPFEVSPITPKIDLPSMHNLRHPAHDTNEALNKLIGLMGEANARSQELLVNLNDSIIAMTNSAKEDEKNTREALGGRLEDIAKVAAAEAKVTGRHNFYAIAIAALSLVATAVFSFLQYANTDVQDLSKKIATYAKSNTELVNEMKRANDLEEQALAVRVQELEKRTAPKPEAQAPKAGAKKLR